MASEIPEAKIIIKVETADAQRDASSAGKMPGRGPGNAPGRSPGRVPGRRPRYVNQRLIDGAGYVDVGGGSGGGGDDGGGGISPGSAAVVGRLAARAGIPGAGIGGALKSAGIAAAILYAGKKTLENTSLLTELSFREQDRLVQWAKTKSPTLRKIGDWLRDVLPESVVKWGDEGGVMEAARLARKMTEFGLGAIPSALKVKSTSEAGLGAQTRLNYDPNNPEAAFEMAWNAFAADYYAFPVALFKINMAEEKRRRHIERMNATITYRTLIGIAGLAGLE